jgi:cytochrome c oxidase assembly protein subunit 15
MTAIAQLDAPYAVRDRQSRNRALVRGWLYVVLLVMFALFLVGGATRLTDSGLSITEWKPIHGVIPPLSDAEWQEEFAKYQQIPEYRQLHADMTLGDFKTIFWWEWAHRLLGRLIGAAFLLPFLWFLWRGWVKPALRGRLWLIFGLGALQGAVGWWMVASGLAERVEVSQYRLAFHLSLACVIYAAVLWTAERLDRAPAGASRRLRATAIALVGLVLAQIYLGALVAGLRAGLVYNTWPLIDGALIPDAARLWFEQPAWRNLFENALTVQFMHRMVAYALWLFAVVHAVDVARSAGDKVVRLFAFKLAAAVTIQAALGILTLVHQVPIGLALAHQAMAVVVLTLATLHAQRLAPRPATVRAAVAVEQGT